jgi:histidyl-tRNA synthetase
VPAVGISIGFERAVDLVSSEFGGTGVVLVCSDMSKGLAIQRALIAAGDIVRIERKPNNVKALLASMAAQGFTRFAFVDAETTVASLELRSID